MDFSGLDVGLRRVREEQADLHAPAGAAIDLCFVTARSCPAIAAASRDPRDPSSDIVRWILRCGMIGHSGPAAHGDQRPFVSLCRPGRLISLPRTESSAH